MSDEEEKVYMLTGHREVNELVVFPVFKAFWDTHDGSALGGGAKGADYGWVKGAKDAGREYHLMIPHVRYYETYHPVRLENWQAMLAGASSVTYVVPETQPWDWHYNMTRNIVMVELADRHVVCAKVHPHELLKLNRGGTVHCVKAMKRLQVECVLWINSETGEETIVRL